MCPAETWILISKEYNILESGRRKDKLSASMSMCGFIFKIHSEPKMKYISSPSIRNSTLYTS